MTRIDLSEIHHHEVGGHGHHEVINLRVLQHLLINIKLYVSQRIKLLFYEIFCKSFGSLAFDAQASQNQKA